MHICIFIEYLSCKAFKQLMGHPWFLPGQQAVDQTLATLGPADYCFNHPNLHSALALRDRFYCGECRIYRLDKSKLRSVCALLCVIDLYLRSGDHVRRAFILRVQTSLYIFRFVTK